MHVQLAGCLAGSSLLGQSQCRSCTWCFELHGVDRAIHLGTLFLFVYSMDEEDILSDRVLHQSKVEISRNLGGFRFVATFLAYLIIFIMQVNKFHVRICNARTDGSLRVVGDSV